MIAISASYGSRGGAAVPKRGNSGLPWENSAFIVTEVRAKPLPPSAAEVIAAVCAALHCQPEDCTPRRQGVNLKDEHALLPRRLVRYLMAKCSGMNYRQISCTFGSTDNTSNTSVWRTVRYIEERPQFKALARKIAQANGWKLRDGANTEPAGEAGWQHIVGVVCWFFDCEPTNVTGPSERYDPWLREKMIARWLAAHVLLLDWASLTRACGLSDSGLFRDASRKVEERKAWLTWAMVIAADYNWTLYERRGGKYRIRDIRPNPISLGARCPALPVPVELPDEEMGEKMCGACGKVKPIRDFKHHRRPSGEGNRRHTYCKVCMKLYKLGMNREGIAAM